MIELNITEIDEVSGGMMSFFEDIGYTVGYAAGYFYRNVMIGNGAVDDLAQMVR